MSHCAQSLPSYPDQPDLALVAALTLISRYTSTQSPAVAEAALAQLRAVAEDARHSDELRKCAASLAVFWESKLKSACTCSGRQLH